MRNLTQGQAPRNHIDADIHTGPLIRENDTPDTRMLWVRDHIGIEGNERAEKLAEGGLNHTQLVKGNNCHF